MTSPSEMSVEVHPLMEDAYNIDAAFDQLVKHEMRPARILAITRSDVITRPAQAGIIRQHFDDPPNLANIELGLINAPVRRAIIPYLVNVALRARA
jgi:hypothetical protein